METLNNKLRYLATAGWLILLSVLFHFPRIFFIADESSRISGQTSLLGTYPSLCKWDCGFYHYLANHADLAVSKQNAAFFPTYPLFLAAFHWLFSEATLSALSVVSSNFFSMAAIASVILLGSKLWGDGLASERLLKFTKPALLLGLGVAIYPHAQFFSYGYSEPLFLLFYALCLLAMFSNRWKTSALFCGLAAVTRPQGLWILGAFLLISGWRLHKDYRASRRVSWALIMPTIIAATPFAILLCWQQLAFGSPIAFLQAQAAWGRHFDFVAGLKNNIPKFDQSRIFNVMAILSAYSFFRRKKEQWIFLALVTLMMSEIPLFFGGFFSYPRFSALNLGVFIFLTEFAKERFWLTIALLILAITRLDVEVYSWMTSSVFIF